MSISSKYQVLRLCRTSVTACLATIGLGACSLMPADDQPAAPSNAQLDARVAQLERVVGNDNLLELSRRIDRLQAEMRDLRGEMDVLRNDIRRLAEIRREPLAESPAVTTQAPAAPIPEAVRASDEAATTYNLAFDALKSGQYETAIKGFATVVERFPQHELAENAQYWLGETYYVTLQYEAARDAFADLVSRWPKSRKAPDALLKLGYTYLELGNTDKGQEILRQVAATYRDTDAGRLAQERLDKRD
ncbi:MAG: tol-pal system protein YbgF [Steroidobacteraceae bacterium]